jgi:hypothetical protein
MIKNQYLWSDETKAQGIDHLLTHLTPYRSLQSYDTSPKPTVTVVYEPLKNYSIIGSGFGTSPILYIGNTRLTSFFFNSDTNITFRFPAIGGGNYLMRIENPGVGYALQSWFGAV